MNDLLKSRIKRLRLNEARESRERITKRVLPLQAHYGAEPAQEAVRSAFYDDCAKAFGWKDWPNLLFDPEMGKNLDGLIDKPLPPHGYGGRGQDVTAIERNRLIAINQNSSPFEWLASKGYLETQKDQPGIGNVRFSAGIRLRDLLTGAEPSGLKSFNIEGTSGAGGPPTIISDYKMDCIKRLDRIRADLTVSRLSPEGFGRIARNESNLFNVLERIIYRDEWFFDGLTKLRQSDLIAQIQFALDNVASSFGMITPKEFDQRWFPERLVPQAASSKHPEKPQ